MASHRIGVFPASGGIGGGIVKHLLPRHPVQDLVFIARNTTRLDFAAAAGATIRKADYDSNADMEHAFDGIDTLFLISYASVEVEHRAEVRCDLDSPRVNDQLSLTIGPQRHRAAIDFAIRAGVKYIFYGSLGFAGREDNKETVAHVMRPHLVTEKYLEECVQRHPRFAYTVVREGLYSESYNLYTAFFDPRNPVEEIKIAHDGTGPGIAWVKREELGEGTAELLKRFAENPAEFKYRNKTVLLSGTKVLTLQQTVDVLARLANRPVTIRQVSDEEFGKQPEVGPNFTYVVSIMALPGLPLLRLFVGERLVTCLHSCVSCLVASLRTLKPPLLPSFDCA